MPAKKNTKSMKNTKSTTVKSVKSKKATLKKSTKAKSKKVKKYAAPHEFFFFADGRAAKSIGELAFMLDDMAEEVFKHHVNEAKNDFASWIEQVFDEKQLAEILKQERELIELQNKLFRHLAKKAK